MMLMMMVMMMIMMRMMMRMMMIMMMKTMVMMMFPNTLRLIITCSQRWNGIVQPSWYRSGKSKDQFASKYPQTDRNVFARMDWHCTNFSWCRSCKSEGEVCRFCVEPSGHLRLLCRRSCDCVGINKTARNDKLTSFIRTSVNFRGSTNLSSEPLSTEDRDGRVVRRSASECFTKP